MIPVHMPLSGIRINVSFAVDCVRMCDNVQNINAIDFAYRGTEAQVMPAFNKKIAETDCVGCGQCRVVCPTGAISIRTNIDEVWEALADKNQR